MNIRSLSWYLPDDVQKENIECILRESNINVHSLILPIDNKDCWYNCAKIISFQEDRSVVAFLPALLAWYKDLNWPGCDIITSKIYRLPFGSVVDAYKSVLAQAQRDGDTEWEENLIQVFQRFENPFHLIDHDNYTR